MIGCCGNNCSTCIAFLATQADDDAMRAEVAKKWTVEYNTDFQPEQINCDGCTAEGRHIGFCEHACTIRKCCVGKEHLTCASCDEYPCDELSGFFQNVSEARSNLDALRPRGA
ncbi:DUF3795 domain-containing protein [bacterium]|nr:DUF3795 domain-containing protein [bacterium]